MAKSLKRLSVNGILLIIGCLAVLQIWSLFTQSEYTDNQSNLKTGRLPKAFFVQIEDEDHDWFGKSSENWPDVDLLVKKVKSYLDEHANTTLNYLYPWSFSMKDSQDYHCKNMALNFSSVNISSQAVIIVGVGDSTLQQTLTSIMFLLHNTNKEFVSNIYVVADNRLNEEDFEVLEDLLVPLPFFRTFHLPSYTANLRGMAFTTGFTNAQIYVFVDAKVIVYKDWLQPLMVEIEQNYSTVAVPMVMPTPSQSQHNLDWYLRRRRDIDWALNMRWNVPRSSTNIVNILTKQPAVYENLFAVSAQFFKQIGGFDYLQRGEGAEAVLWSIKTWMCKGQILRSSCSKIIEFQESVSVRTKRHEVPLVEKVMSYKNYIAQALLGNFQKYHTCLKHLTAKSLFYYSKAMKTYKHVLKCDNFVSFISRSKSDLTVPPRMTDFHGDLKLMHKNVFVSVDMTHNRLFLVNTESPMSSDFHFTRNNIIHGRDFCFDVRNEKDIVLSSCNSVSKTKPWIWDRGMVKKRDHPTMCITRVEDTESGESGIGKLILASCPSRTVDNVFEFSLEYKHRCL